MRFLLVFCLFSGIILIEGDLLKPCRDSREVNDWFKWSQFYSFCMQYDSIILSSTSSQVDEKCREQNCQQCQHACLDGPYTTVEHCKKNCTSDACKYGCEFFFNGKTETFVPDTSKVPSFSNSTKDIKEFDVVKHVLKLFTWTAIPSQGTIYVVYITLNHQDFPLALSTEKNFTLDINDLCSVTQGSLKEYSLTVTPVNSHGWKYYFAKNGTFDIPKITDISFGKPFFHTYKNGRIDIIFPLNILANFPNISSVRVIYFAECHTSPVPIEYINLGEIRQARHVNQTFNFPYQWERHDRFKGCKLKYTATGRYQCYNTKFSKIYTYEGCHTVKGYQRSLCVFPNSTVLTTITTTTMVRIVSLRMNQSSLMCHKYENSTSVCVKGQYNITISWEPQVVKFKYYVLSYGPPVIMISRYIIPDQNKTDVKLMNNTTSYTIHNVSAGYIIGAQLFILYENERRTKVTSDPSVIHLPELGKHAEKTQTNVIQETKGKIPKKNSNETRDIIIAVIVPISAFLLILGLLFYCRRQKDIPIKDMEKYERGFEPSIEKIQTDEWEVLPTYIKMEDEIGEGAFGRVFSAFVDASVVSKSNYAKRIGGAAYLSFEKNPKVAIKLLKEGASDVEWNDFKEEINFMKNIGYHKNIVNMIGCSTVKAPLCLLVEYMQHGDLLHYLRKGRSKLVSSKFVGGELSPVQGFMYNKNFEALLQSYPSSNESSVNTNSGGTHQSVYSVGSADSGFYDPEDLLTPDDLLCFAWQIASGMEFLSLNKVVHRDLAARNILIGPNKMAKISDFGLSRQVGSELMYMSSRNQKLPIKWMSVEAIFDKVFTAYSDVWAYGVVLFEIVTLGGTPYPSINNIELLNLLKSGYRMEKPQNCADSMYEIMMHCWNEDALRRPTFTELRDYLEDIMSQGSRYLSLDIDEQNVYYNVASFNSVPSDEDLVNECGLGEENPVFIMTMDEYRKDLEKRQGLRSDHSPITLPGITLSDEKDLSEPDLNEKNLEGSKVFKNDNTRLIPSNTERDSSMRSFSYENELNSRYARLSVKSTASTEPKEPLDAIIN